MQYLRGWKNLVTNGFHTATELYCRLKVNQYDLNMVQEMPLDPSLFFIRNKSTIFTKSLQTASNLQQHERQHSNKRKRSQPLRIRKKPKSYADEYQKDVQVQDDFREYSDDSPVAETGLEVRSVDSRSEGSLRDFIVQDDDEEEKEEKKG